MTETNTDFHKVSYDLHRAYRADHNDKVKLKSWTDESTVDAWRHQRLYSNLDILLSEFPKASWLTVGDGRYGTDAHYIEGKGLDVLATDIAEHNLRMAHEDGFISKFKVENVENLSFDDGQFDFTLCKESYHHFPRPMIGLYEMLRVSSKGIALIDTNDNHILTTAKTKLMPPGMLLWRSLKYYIKHLLGRPRYSIFGEVDLEADYEPVGNYVFSVSERELIKVALGLNLDMIAFKELNDHYVDGVEFEKLDESSALFKEVKRVIDERDSLCEKGLKGYTHIISLIFKKKPSVECIELLKKDGFRIKMLPKNPYITEK